MESLSNVILNLDLDQRIIDSISELLVGSKSIKIFILRRKSLSQYTLDFSSMITALRKSKHLCYALLDCNLESNPIAIPANQEIYDGYKLRTFYKPLWELFGDHQCKLKTLEIVEDNALIEGIEGILCELLK